jgi:hypothetical protein
MLEVCLAVQASGTSITVGYKKYSTSVPYRLLLAKPKGGKEFESITTRVFRIPTICLNNCIHLVRLVLVLDSFWSFDILGK